MMLDTLLVAFVCSVSFDTDSSFVDLSCDVNSNQASKLECQPKFTSTCFYIGLGGRIVMIPQEN